MSYVTHNEETHYMLEQLKAVLATDSPTGYTRHAAALVYHALQALGFAPQYTNKGGVLVCLSDGEPSERGNGILLEAHLDTLGAMVAQVKDNGRLRVTPLGGVNANNAENRKRLCGHAGWQSAGRYAANEKCLGTCQWRIQQNRAQLG